MRRRVLPVEEGFWPPQIEARVPSIRRRIRPRHRWFPFPKFRAVEVSEAPIRPSRTHHAASHSRVAPALLATALLVLPLTPDSALAITDAQLSELRAQVDANPDEPYLRIALAEQELAAGRAQAALAQFGHIRTRWPELAPAFELPLARAYLEADEPELALEALDRIVERDPADLEARSYRALALERIGEARRADLELATVASLDPGLAPDVELLRGAMAQRRGRDDEARRHYERAIELDLGGAVSERAFRALTAPAPRRRPLGIGITSGLEFDSNATEESDPDLPGQPGKREDGRSVLALNAVWRTPLAERVAGSDFELGYSAYQTLHFRLDELNRQIHTPYFRGRYALTDRVSLGLDGYYAFELLDSDPYRHAIGLEPQAFFDFGPRHGTTRVFARARRDEYRDAPALNSFERDGYELGVGSEHTWNVPWREGSWITGGVGWSRRNTEARRDCRWLRSGFTTGMNGAVGSAAGCRSPINSHCGPMYFWATAGIDTATASTR